MLTVNRALSLANLPAPPECEVGWPWTEQSEVSKDKMPDGSEWPKISIVTPSYNQGSFLEETIRSVLLQGYPNLEFIIIDGGSSDQTLEIIHKYEPFITYWISEPDEGQAHALNKGFHKATGDLIGWQNSDDFYYPNAFAIAALAATTYPKHHVFYGSKDYLNLKEPDVLTADVHMSSFDLEKMIPNANMSNQSMFFRQDVFIQGNYINQTFDHCMDHEFFWRLIKQGYWFKFIPEIRGCYRLHDNCKGSQSANAYLRDTIKICETLHRDKNLPLTVRKNAWLYLRGTCLDHYGKMDLDLFQQRYRELLLIRKQAIFDFDLSLRYFVSFLGERNLGRIRNAKKKQ